MKLDPNHLEILYAIVDRGGLTEGAAAIGKSQPSVSRTLAMLEDRIGVKLFEAGRRPLVPTELCALLAHEGRKIHQAGRASSQIMDDYYRGKTGAVRVAGTPFFMDGVISELIASFQSADGNVRIDQSYGFPADLLAQLNDAGLELAVMPMRESSVPDHFEFHRILPARNVIACRSAHPLARKTPIRLNDILGYSWLAPPADSPLYHDLRNALESLGVKEIQISFTGGSLSAVTAILARSDALTILPYSVVYMLKRRTALISLPIRIGDPDRHLGILTHKDIALSPQANRLRKYLIAEFRTLSKNIHRADQHSLWRQ